MRFKTQARLVKPNGTITPEGLAALQPSKDSPQTFVAQTFVADTQATVFLPSALAVTFTRNMITVTFTTNTLILNPGDKMALAAPQTIKLVPL